nr:hypothetical protein Q903MT_gene3158 [Picea sitchensis]
MVRDLLLQLVLYYIAYIVGPPNSIFDWAPGTDQLGSCYAIYTWLCCNRVSGLRVTSSLPSFHI